MNFLKICSIASAVFVANLSLCSANSESSATSVSEKVDAIFASWNKTDSPGCVCAVIQDGKIVYEKGYGMADLEHNESLTPLSVFYIASTSKQFTAACIALLVLDGKVSLQDDVRKYIPELHEFAHPVRIEHLIHHTSGVRDYFALLGLTDQNKTATITNDMIVKLLARQRHLNFEPGEEHLYSNSNYVLLAEVVKRVSGKPMTQFAKERIFDPLGMTATHFEDDARQVVQHRVCSYEPGETSGYRHFIKTIEAYGDGNLLTTVEDLARWDSNFYSGQVGGTALIELLLQRGVLNNGKQIDYAFGLDHETYKDLPVISHGGAFMGFRTEFLRFPNQKLSVIVLSNLATMSPAKLTRKVADLYLPPELVKSKPTQSRPAQTPRTPVKIDPAIFDRYAGEYAADSRPGFVISFTREGDRFFSQASSQTRVEIFPSSDSDFFLKVVDAQVTFQRESDGSVEIVTLHQRGDHILHRIKTSTLTTEELAAYPGMYYSDELDVSYDLRAANGKLTITTPQGTNFVLTPRGRDVFSISGGQIVFKRDAQGKIESGEYSFDRIRNVIFQRQGLSTSSAPTR